MAGLCLVPVTCFVVSWAEIKLATLQIGYLQMPPAVIGLLLVLLLVNVLSRIVARKAIFTRQDLLISYVMMVIAAMISSRGLMQKLLPLLVTANYFADDGNEWHDLFFPHLKQPLMAFSTSGPAKQDVAVKYFEGLRGGDHIPWNLWIAPVALWSVLVLLVFGAFLFMASLLRRQWEDNEKLSFPLVQLPLEMAGFGDSREVSLWRNTLMWIGFAFPFAIFSLKGLSVWYPAIPDIPLETDLAQYLTTPPWNGIYYTPLKFSFALVGFMFLLPSDLVFSLWFFFVLSRIQDIVMKAANIDMPSMPMYPCPLYRGYQAMGAYLVLTVYLFRIAAPHLRMVWRSVIGEEKADDGRELFSYRTAFTGFWLCALGAGIFLVWMGMSPLLAAMQLLGLFLVTGFIMARSTAEAGMLMTEASFRPVDLLRLFVPLHTLGPANLTALALTDSLLMRDQRSLLLGGFLDGLRISDGARISRKQFAGAAVVAIFLAMICAAVIQIAMPYQLHGGLNLYDYVYQSNNKWGFEDYHQYMRPGALPVGWQGTTFLLVGTAVTAFLVWGRATLSVFPFHPLGYALCSSWTMIVFWFSAFLAWGVKSLILRYGGMKLYRQARPLFLGFILGEFASALLWTLANAMLNTPVPTFPWT
jgi:hypothetical protein